MARSLLNRAEGMFVKTGYNINALSTLLPSLIFLIPAALGSGPVAVGAGLIALTSTLRGITMCSRGLMTEALIANKVDEEEGLRLASKKWFRTNLDDAYTHLCTGIGATVTGAFGLMFGSTMVATLGLSLPWMVAAVGTTAVVGGFIGKAIGKLDSSIFTAVREGPPKKVSDAWFVATATRAINTISDTLSAPLTAPFRLAMGALSADADIQNVWRMQNSTSSN